ncbi:MAG: GatB/YqeY domain-containing protein [Clostridia bacterium]|nr:GatB/YqeY domain-containing protein [Clostridia bacterium]
MDINFFKKEKIQAMKDRNKDAINALDLIVNKILLASIDKRAKGEEVTDADVVSILQKCEKELIEEKEGFVKANRPDNVASLDAQIATVQKYLPKLMSKDEIKAEIEKLDDKSIPNVMKHFKTNFAGKCDMGLVNQVLRSM